jgi:hypothetical protein
MLQAPAKQLELQIKDVAQLWRRSGRTPGTIALYLQWVRRYHVACADRSLDACANLTPLGVALFCAAIRWTADAATRSLCCTLQFGQRTARMVVGIATIGLLGAGVEVG